MLHLLVPLSPAGHAWLHASTLGEQGSSASIFVPEDEHFTLTCREANGLVLNWEQTGDG